MTEFREAIAWQGPARLGFIVFGVWESRTLDRSSSERIAAALKAVTPRAEVDPSIATDEGWPCKIGVFDIELTTWPEPVERACEAWLDVVSRAGARVGWMMFDGMFNEVRDIFSPAWSKHIYAIKAERNTAEIDLAIADTARHSVDWGGTVASHRDRILEMYPQLRPRGT